MRDPRQIIELLLRKTVANGCTPGEAASAGEKAAEMATRHGIPLDECREAPPRPREQPKYNPWTRSGERWHHWDASAADAAWAYTESVRRAQAAAMDAERARRAENERRQATRKSKFQFKTVRQCADHYLSQGMGVDDVLDICTATYPRATILREWVDDWYKVMEHKKLERIRNRVAWESIFGNE